jgi:hypothetical protein
MRLKFFKRSAEKFQSRIDPDSEAYRDLYSTPHSLDHGFGFLN